MFSLREAILFVLVGLLGSGLMALGFRRVFVVLLEAMGFVAFVRGNGLRRVVVLVRSNGLRRVGCCLLCLSTSLRDVAVEDEMRELFVLMGL
jgi:hypothetical protein